MQLRRDALERWAAHIGVDMQTAEEMRDWCLERLEGARAGDIHPVIVLQTAALLYWMTAAACRLPEGRALEMWDATRREVMAVAEELMGNAEPGDGVIVAPGLVIQ